MSIKNQEVRAVLECTHLSPRAKLILIEIVSRPKGWVAQRSTLRELSQCSDGTLSGLIRELREAGLIRSRGKGGDGKERPGYVLTDPQKTDL